MTDVRTLTGKALREEFTRLRGKMLARIDELPEDDLRRSALEAVLQVGDGIVQHAARTAGHSFVEALAASELPVPPPVEDLFADRDPEEREQVAEALNDLLQGDTHQADVQSLDEPEAPAQPARPKLPPVPKAPAPIRRNENAAEREVQNGLGGAAAGGGGAAGARADRPGGQGDPGPAARPVAPAPRPVQPAPRAPAQGRPAAQGTLGGLKKTRQEQRAEEPEPPVPAKASPSPRPAPAAPKCKPAFKQTVPPMEPGDEDIEF